ncbi:TMX2 family protein [Megaselia abdita]
MTFKKDLKLLAKPYYWVNIFMSLSYMAAKKTPGLCHYLFANKEEMCEFGGRETEILFFLAIIVMIRSRKTGSVTMINYLTSSFIYTKVANLILWSIADVLYGVIFLIAFVVLAMVVPEPTYKGPEHVTYFRNAQSFEEELTRDKRVTWIICFYTAWNPSCVNFASIFSQISSEYHLENLRFGKIDVGRFPESARKYNINDGSLSRQLPTVILFKQAKEVDRRPSYDSKGKITKFYFSYDNLVAGIGLNSLYKECVENPIKVAKKTAVEKKTE